LSGSALLSISAAETQCDPAAPGDQSLHAHSIFHERRLSEDGPNGGSGEREAPFGRTAFARFVGMTTRWRDNDVYGHLNNVAYYELFDAAVNQILIEAGLLDPGSSPIIGFVAESNCRFFSSLSYPDRIEIGVKVERLGRASVRYALAAFKEGAPVASAQGRYTHVYVDRASGKPAPIPEGHRRLMRALAVPEMGG
jgi:acyl-CoA thioester hydrolase